MVKHKHYLALDFGISNGAAVAGLFDGDTIKLDPLHRFAVRHTTMLHTNYWDFPAMMIDAKQGLAVFAAKYGANPAGVACDSWGVDFGLLDKTGHLLANPVYHLDPRSKDAVDKLHAAVPERSLYQRTGIKGRRECTLYQLYSMAQANSPLLDKAVTMLLMADLVAYFLSGTPVQEYTLATTTGMYDAETRDWSRDVILSAKIPPVMVPEIVAPGTIIGPLLDSVAAECGLGQVPVIAPGSHSMASAAAAIPSRDDDWLYIVSGDWDQIGVELQEPIINDASFAAGFNNEGGVDGTIRLTKGVLAIAILNECVRAWSDEDGRPLNLSSILDMAFLDKPGERVVNLDDPRIYAAADMPSFLNMLLAESGQPAAETRTELIRTCIDSLVVAIRLAVSQLAGITGGRYSGVSIVGWGAGIKNLNQAVADATGLPVRSGPVEAKAVGNIAMQAIALGDFASLAEARECVERSFGTEYYEPSGDPGAWDEAYERFVKMV